jgi:hypothetical protein
LDISGNRITTGTPAGREWVIEFTLYRPTTMQIPPTILSNTVPAANLAITQTQIASPPIRGSYKLWFGGVPISVWNSSLSAETTDINFDQTWDVNEGLMTALANRDIFMWTHNRGDDGVTIFFRFYGDSFRGPLTGAF